MNKKKETLKKKKKEKLENHRVKEKQYLSSLPLIELDK